MRPSQLFLHLTVVLWGAGIVYGCAVGADETASGDCILASEGCPCTPGGACDPGLECLSDLCVDRGGMGGQTAAPASGPGPAGQGGAMMASGPSTTGTTTTTSGPAATTGATTTATTTTTGGGCALAEPTNVTWCSSDCSACGSWPITWDAVPNATHYRVRWSCSIAPENTSADIFATSVDFANSSEVNAGGLGCGFSVHSVYVMACDATCCTSGALVPTNTLPPACGGGCCA